MKCGVLVLLPVFVFFVVGVSPAYARDGRGAAVEGQQGVHTLQVPPGPPRRNPSPPCFDDANRYVDCGNGTVTDTVTGLVWLKDASCLGSAPWAAANNLAAALAEGDCGLTDGSVRGDWRLPTMLEWAATVAQAVRLGCVFASSPSLTNDPGTACLSAGLSAFDLGASDINFWSSTADEVHPFFALNAYLVDGIVSYASFKTAALRVWPVRAH